MTKTIEKTLADIEDTDLESLYNRDYLLWLETTAKQLRKKNFEALDLDYLIEEIEILGNEQRRKVESYLRQLLKHLLFYQYWSLPDCKNHWAVEIDNFRIELQRLTRSKTLYNHLVEIKDEVYVEAVRQAKRKSELTCFPETCPYEIDQILDIDFYPNQVGSPNIMG